MSPIKIFLLYFLKFCNHEKLSPIVTCSTLPCHYGYDQRVEAFGALGMVRSNNLRPTEVTRYSGNGTAQRDELMYFFIERYRAAYEGEIRDFIDNVTAGKPPSVTFEDGHRALLLAEAAITSFRENRPVEVIYS